MKVKSWLLTLIAGVVSGGLLGADVGCGSAGVVTGTAPTPPVTPHRNALPKFAYTANQGASLSGYSVDPVSGALTPLSGFPVSVGLNPDILAHDSQNRFLFVGDNAAFMLHVYAIDANTGALSEISPSPYSTMIQPGTMIVDPAGTHLYVYRTGANVQYPGVSGNQIAAYNLSATGVLTPVNGSPLAIGAPAALYTSATGIAIDATGRFLYLQDPVNLYVFRIDATSGALTLQQTVPSQYGGGIALDPLGTYLYAAGSNQLLSYAVDANSGQLSLARATPTVEQSGAYTISLSPDGNFAYTIEKNNDLVSYAVSGGGFAPAGQVYAGIYGQHIAVDPSGSFVYVPQACSNCPTGVYNVVHQFSIAKSGALTPLTVADVPAGRTPVSIVVTSQ